MYSSPFLSEALSVQMQNVALAHILNVLMAHYAHLTAVMDLGNNQFNSGALH
jgi:hypothetical protein